MKIEKDRVVRFHYAVSVQDGGDVESSEGREPIAILAGHGNIIPGLEQALAGRKTGDSLTADIAPEQGYGPRHDGLIQVVPRSAFEGVDSVQPGMQFEARTAQGPLMVTVTKVDTEEVTVDGNHPLAGQNLHFDVQVADVREASEAELNQGHVDAA